MGHPLEGTLRGPAEGHGRSLDRDTEEAVVYDAEDPLGDNVVPNKDEFLDDSADPVGVIKGYLLSLKERLIQEMETNPWPKCYLNGQFWIYLQILIFPCTRVLKEQVH